MSLVSFIWVRYLYDIFTADMNLRVREDECHEASNEGLEKTPQRVCTQTSHE